MNINYKAENKENKQLNLEKRNKQNSGIPKPVLYTGLSIAGVAAISIIGKILYDRSQKNDNNNPSSQNKKKTTEINVQENNPKGGPADNYNPNVKITDKNYLMAFKQKDSYCFHNAWLQLLACPDIRCKKYGLPNTDKAISWINSIIAGGNDTMTLHHVECGNPCSVTVEVPKEIRLQTEIKFKNPLTNEEIDVTDYEDFDVKKGAVPEGKGGANFPYAVGGILNACYKKKIDVSNFMPGNLGPFWANDINDHLKVNNPFAEEFVPYNSWNEVPAVLLDLGVIKISNTQWRFFGVENVLLPQDVKNGNGPENFLAQIQLEKQNIDGSLKLSNEMYYFMNGFYGYKPTFGIVRTGAGHYDSFYIIYDQNNQIKKILLNTGEGFQEWSNNYAPLNNNSIDGFIRWIFGCHAPCWFKYSNQDIVKKYYTEFN